jgi:hypothetical protein
MKHPVSLDPIPEQENTKFHTPQILKTENQWLRPRSNSPMGLTQSPPPPPTLILKNKNSMRDRSQN